MTNKAFHNYSVTMESELKELEQKVSQVVTVVKQLRAENQALRQQLATRADDNKRLTEKVTAARARLEALLKHLPDETP